MACSREDDKLLFESRTMNTMIGSVHVTPRVGIASKLRTPHILTFGLESFVTWWRFNSRRANPERSSSRHHFESRSRRSGCRKAVCCSSSCHRRMLLIHFHQLLAFDVVVIFLLSLLLSFSPVRDIFVDGSSATSGKECGQICTAYALNCTRHDHCIKGYLNKNRLLYWPR